MSLPCEKTQDHVLPVAPEGLYDRVPCGPWTSSPLTTPPPAHHSSHTGPHCSCSFSLASGALHLSLPGPAVPPDCHVGSRLNPSRTCSNPSSGRLHTCTPILHMHTFPIPLSCSLLLHSTCHCLAYVTNIGCFISRLMCPSIPIRI